MTRLYWIAAGLLLAVVLGFGVWSCHGQHVVDQAMQAASQHHETAVTQSAQAVIHDQAVQELQPDLERYKSEVARLKAKLAAIHPSQGPSAHSGVSIPPVEPGGLENVGSGVGGLGNGTLQQVVEKQDELIAAQDTQIKGLEAQVSNLTLSRDSWKSAYEASAQESASLRLAHQAQIAAIQGARWKGRLEGFAVGIVSGYVYGRTH